MTYEAEAAKKSAVHFEAKKDGLKQVQSGDVKVTLTIAASDMPPSLYNDIMGQRYVIAMVALNDDETPKEKPKSYAQQAKLMAKDDTFQQFLCRSLGNQMEPELAIENECGVTSCAELIEGTDAGKRFKRLQAEYLQWRDN